MKQELHRASRKILNVNKLSIFSELKGVSGILSHKVPWPAYVLSPKTPIGGF
jgi:hypothetical protein